MKLRLLTASLSTMACLLVGAVLMGGVAFAGAPVSQAAGEPSATATPPACVPFEVVASPGIGIFMDMAVVSANDIWAAGFGAGTGRGAYVAHWNGSEWSHVPAPQPPGDNQDELHDITVVSANDIWAAGYYLDYSTNRHHSLIEHWDGSTWSIVSDPGSTGTIHTFLLGADAASANDVWAVGYLSTFPNSQLYIERWNGSQWNVVPGPAFGSDVHTFLTDVDAISASDAYAAGYAINATTGQTYNLIIRWNGSAWSVVPTPNLGSTPTQLNSITVLAANDIWAVGHTGSIFGAAETFTMHWNGSAWSIVPSPSLGAGTNLLERVSAASANDVWAVGLHREPASPFRTRTIAMRWNGSSWSIVPTANPSAQSNTLYGVVALSANNVWAVGSQASSSTPDLIEHYTGPCVGATATATTAPLTSTSTAVPPTSTNTSMPPTATNTAAPPTATATATPCPLFPIVPSPGFGTLLDVEAVSANDIWAVGYTSGTGTSTYVLHWDGSAWSHMPSPNPTGSSSSVLFDLTVISANDIWAVGYGYESTPGRQQALTEHWDGSAWSIVSNPGSTDSFDTSLMSVDASSANDLWAIGSRGDRPYTVHWDGAHWKRVPAPAFGADVETYLFDVAAVSANDAYAVGVSANFATGEVHNVIIRWNGSEWRIVPTPNLGVIGTALNSIDVISANDIWAVGFAGGRLDSRTFTMHWNGSAWSIVPSPNLGPNGNYLEKVAAASANEVWAVGAERSPGEPYHNRTLAMRWNGSSWSIVPTTDPTSDHNILYGVVALSANDVWAVGNQSDNLESDLIEHYTGPCPGGTPSPTPMPTNTVVPPTSTNTPVPVTTSTVVPSTSTNTPQPVMTNTPVSTSTPVASTATVTVAPTSIVSTPTAAIATSTPAEATATAVAATATAIPPTACSMQFSDVAEGSTFYPYVRCLVCRGIISGYTDGTFRPNNNVTRGQIAKMVSNAAGFADDPGTQIYDDVPPGSTFYTWVNRLSHRGIVSGYPCPDPTEDCMPTDASYFRPEAYATRGQLSKIVSNSAGFDEGINSQTFEDVTSGSPFYVWVERLATRSIMGGYACGGAGKPCGEGNRPYFRPAVEITRGQTAKVVANTFFAGCQTMSGR